MKSTIYKSKIGELELSTLTRLYPAAIIEIAGDSAEMSLEWVEQNGEKVNIVSYILVFDYTPIGAEKKDRKVLEFSSKEELMHTIGEVAPFFH